jgi:hypothetical protein
MDSPRDAFTDTDTATFAIKEIGLEIPILCLFDSHIGAKNIADPAFDTSVFIPDGTHGPPVAAFIGIGISGILYHTADGKILPCHLVNRFHPFLL